MTSSADSRQCRGAPIIYVFFFFSFLLLNESLAVKLNAVKLTQSLAVKLNAVKLTQFLAVKLNAVKLTQGISSSESRWSFSNVKGLKAYSSI